MHLTQTVILLPEVDKEGSLMNEWCTMWLLPYADHFNTQAFSFPWTTHNTLLGCHQPNLGKNLNCHLKRSATITLILYTLTSRCSAWVWSIKIVCTPCCSSMQQHGGLSLPGGCSKQHQLSLMWKDLTYEIIHRNSIALQLNHIMLERVEMNLHVADELIQWSCLTDHQTEWSFSHSWICNVRALAPLLLS